MNVTQWHGCYSDSWQGVITPDAFAHPAKFARGLIRRIYEHMLAAGYLAPGDRVIDPFGGVALGGLDAMSLGLHWHGCELEERFVALGQQNIAKWQRDLAMLGDRVGTARLLQGDSRRLLEVVGAGMAGVVSSPPYAESLNDTRTGGGIDLDKCKLERSKLGQNGQGAVSQSYGLTPGQLGAMPSGDYAAAVSSPPYDSNTVHSDTKAVDRFNTNGGKPGQWGSHATGAMAQGDYGTHPGQLGAMPSGDYAAAVSSPPYAETNIADARHLHFDISRQSASILDKQTNGIPEGYGGADGQLGSMPVGSFDSAVSSPPYADAVNGTGEGPGARYDTVHHNADTAQRLSSDNGYGATDGQLGRMAGEGWSAAVSSPPYEGMLEGDRKDGERQPLLADSVRQKLSKADLAGRFYGSDPANIGNDTGGTFWAAARLICEQTYAALRPGGYAAWVCKDFVRKGQRVPFSDQWEQLCVAVGFEPVERIHAMLVADHGTQLDIFGNGHARRVERKSFFRRLAEKKGSPRIDHEDVIILRKPL